MTKDRTMEDSISSVDSGTAVSLGMALHFDISCVYGYIIIRTNYRIY